MNHSHQSLVSIIMPCYNGEKTLALAVASLINQTYENWELVFIDDGSTDGSADLVHAVDDPRIRIFSLDRNYGRGAARQKGNEEARGEYVAMLDTDDWWYSTKLEKQMLFLSTHPDVSLVGTGLVAVDEKGSAVGCRRCKMINSSIMHTLGRPPLAYATVCMRKKIAAKYRYNRRYRLGQDTDFLQRVCLQNRFANLPEPLYVYSEYRSFNWKKINQRYLSRLRSLMALSSTFSYHLFLEICRSSAVMVISNLMLAMGQYRRLIQHNSTRPTAIMLEIYETEKRMTYATADKVFAAPNVASPYSN